ncbi:MAG TPA: hypothetical protein PLV42_07025 [bacterium]|nr:hypothetical protein [bacterium]
MVKNIMASSPVKSMLSEWDRRYRAATFNALKQEGYRKISIRDNGDGTATIKYKDPREVTR